MTFQANLQILKFHFLTVQVAVDPPWGDVRNSRTVSVADTSQQSFVLRGTSRSTIPTAFPHRHSGYWCTPLLKSYFIEVKCSSP